MIREKSLTKERKIVKIFENGTIQMKRNIIRAVKILSLLLAVGITLGLLQEYVFYRADHNRERIKGFYLEDSRTLDVVYLGASEVYSDIAPGCAYAHSGVTGYLYATQANTILNYKSQLKSILERQPTALVVIELNGALYDDEDIKKEANLHNYADNIPLSFNKLGWIFETAPDNPLEYIFPFIKYHGILSDPEEEKEKSAKYRDTIADDRARGYNLLKGILNWTVVFKSPEPCLNDTLPDAADQRQPLAASAEKGLRDLLAYCRDEGLTNVVFARFPHIVTERTYDRFLRGNTVGDIVAEYGYDYLNFERDIAMTGLDEEKDFYNLDHLNVSGQQKFTAFLTDYLTERYTVVRHALSADQRAEWELCADYYAAYVRRCTEMTEERKVAELSEDRELIETLAAYLP